MAKKKDYKRKTDFITEVEHFDFTMNKDTHKEKKYSMIKLPTRVNPNTGYGEGWSLGVSKAKACLDNIEALEAFVIAHEDELTTIKGEAHLKKEKGK